MNSPQRVRYARAPWRSIPSQGRAARRLTSRNECRYAPAIVIRSFADKRTAAVFAGNRVPSLPAVLQPRARQKLLMIDAAVRLDDLRAPPSNRLELLRGQRKGQHSIRINNQWRVCFEWRDGDALSAEITNYHR